MINVPLYNALAAVFGKVLISNEDEPAHIVEKASAVARQAPKLRPHGGEQYRVCCPFCGDKRHRLYISHAWNTRVKIGGLRMQDSSLLICHNEDCLSDRDNYERLATAVLARIDPSAEVPVIVSEGVMPDQEQKKIQLPAGAAPLSAHSLPGIVKYVRERGFDPDVLGKDWNVCTAHVPYYGTEVLVFPIYKDSRLVTWQARFPGESYKYLGKHKYFWPAGTRKSWLLYNIDMAKMFPFVILVEGITDTLRVGFPSVAMFGKKVSTYQLKLLRDIWSDGTLIVIPDTDDVKSIKNAVDLSNTAAGDFRGGVEVIRLPGGDPGSTPRSEIWDLILKRRPELSRYADAGIR